MEALATGDALFTFGLDLVVRSWNNGAAALTGVPESEAVGRTCWEVLGARAADGALLCHAGCCTARHAAEGWPVKSATVSVRGREGRRRVTLATVVSGHGDQRTLAHLLVPVPEAAPAPSEARAVPTRTFTLTTRQREVLALLGSGRTATQIARELGISIATARNHLHAIRTELSCSSQVEAAAIARQAGLV